MFKKLFGLVAALLFCAQAHAAFPPTSGYSCYAPNYPQWGTYTDSTQLGCAQKVFNASHYGGSGQQLVCAPGNGEACGASWTGEPPHSGNIRVTAENICPVNSTLEGVSCTCNSGFAESGSSCVPTSAACPVGQGRTFNRTEGWARSPGANADDVVVDNGGLSSPYGYNDGVCVGDIAKIDRCYRSQEPSAQGLYRISCDYTMVVTSPSSAPGDPNADPQNDNAACPGVVGTVNGKPMCVGNASNPLPSPSPAPNHPTSAGNPSAGEKPSSGEGSGTTGAGRTPTGGSGGNDGGPASAAAGRGGTGDRGDGEDGTGVCGAPPLPSCNVKVDETGTPAEGTAAGRFGQANTDVDTAQSDAEGFIRGIEDIVLPSWSWTFAFPTGCTPLVLAAFNNLEIDVCQWQPIIHDLMSVIWVIAGIWGFIGLFRNATGV